MKNNLRKTKIKKIPTRKPDYHAYLTNKYIMDGWNNGNDFVFKLDHPIVGQIVLSVKWNIDFIVDKYGESLFIKESLVRDVLEKVLKKMK